MLETMPAAHAAAFWTGLHLILLLTLSGLVVSLRRKHRVALGDGGDPQLTRAVRAFGNATEYVPTGLIALGVLALVGAAPAMVHVVGLVLFAGRVTHAVSLSRSGGASPARAAGVMMTWVAYVLAAAALLFYAIP
jgi:uncharacterized membrane protein YecN with MAPEG domain